MSGFSRPPSPPPRAACRQVFVTRPRNVREKAAPPQVEGELRTLTAPPGRLGLGIGFMDDVGAVAPRERDWAAELELELRKRGGGGGGGGGGAATKKKKKKDEGKKAQTIVTTVAPDSPLAEYVRPGDIIMKVDKLDTSHHDPGQLSRLLKAKEDAPRRLVLRQAYGPEDRWMWGLASDP